MDNVQGKCATPDPLAFYRSIFRNSPTGMSVYDASGQCIEANGAICTIAGDSETLSFHLYDQGKNEMPDYSGSGFWMDIPAGLYYGKVHENFTPHPGVAITNTPSRLHYMGTLQHGVKSRFFPCKAHPVGVPNC